MKAFILILLLVIFEQTNAQKHIVFPAQVTHLDVSAGAVERFALQLDSIHMGLYDFDSVASWYEKDPKLVPLPFFFRNGMMYGMKNDLWHTLVGCGYHESEDPYKITIRNKGKEAKNDSLYDLSAHSVWISSPDYTNDHINLYFKKGFPPLTTLIFFPGSQKSPSDWTHYSRPRKMQILLNGTKFKELIFEDSISRQVFEIGELSGKKDVVMTLIITDVYPGTDKRVAISEINFDGIIH